MFRRASASVWMARRGRRPWHVRKLLVREPGTRICKVPEGEFDFLGYTFGRMFSARTGQARIGYRPSKKSIQRAVEKIHALTERHIDGKRWIIVRDHPGDVFLRARGHETAQESSNVYVIDKWASWTL
jgi:hypothetical protein